MIWHGYICDRCRTAGEVHCVQQTVSVGQRDSEPNEYNGFRQVHRTNEPMDLCRTCMDAFKRFMKGAIVGEVPEQ